MLSDIGLRIGDYLMIDDEVVRVKSSLSNPATNPLTVFRAVLGTRATTHSSGAVVRRIKPYPIELEDTQLTEHLDIRLNMLDMAPVTIQLLSLKDKIVTSLILRNCLSQTFKNRRWCKLLHWYE